MSKSKGIKEVAYVDVRQARRRAASHAQKRAAGAGVVVRLRGRRAGRGRARHRLHRQHAQPARHDDHRREGSEESEAARRSSTMPPGTHSHKVRVKDGIMVTNREILGCARAERRGAAGRTSQGGLGIYDVSDPSKPKLITNWETTDKPGRELRARRAPLRFRRPLRLHLADDGRLRRQHHDDPRPQGSREARGSRPLVDAGPVGQRAARRRRGKAPRIAATIRCATATGSTRATGTAASSSSTSTT